MRQHSRVNKHDERLPLPVIDVRTTAMVALGGAIGAVARYAILLAFPVARDGFPAGTLVVNCVGALFLGITLGWFDSPIGTRAPTWLRPFLVAGALGAFTTLSLVVVDHAVLIADGRNLEALAFALITLIGTVVIAFVGIALGQRIGNRTQSGAS